MQVTAMVRYFIFSRIFDLTFKIENICHRGVFQGPTSYIQTRNMDKMRKTDGIHASAELLPISQSRECETSLGYSIGQ